MIELPSPSRDGKGPPMSTIPSDDPTRDLTLSDTANPALPHLSVAGDTYTILLTGKDTAGRYCMIDMHVPPGGGPPPHRHDFEESFTVSKADRGYVSGPAGDGRGGTGGQYSGKCPAPVPEHVGTGSAAALCVLAAVWKSFSLKSGFPWRRGQPLLRHPTRRSWRRGGRARRLWRRNTERRS